MNYSGLFRKPYTNYHTLRTLLKYKDGTITWRKFSVYLRHEVARFNLFNWDLVMMVMILYEFISLTNLPKSQ